MQMFKSVSILANFVFKFQDWAVLLDTVQGFRKDEGRGLGEMEFLWVGVGEGAPVGDRVRCLACVGGVICILNTINQRFLYNKIRAKQPSYA